MLHFTGLLRHALINPAYETPSKLLWDIYLKSSTKSFSVLHSGGHTMAVSPHYQPYSCAVVGFVSVEDFTQRIYCAMPCASHREHSEINSHRLTVVPRGYVGANLLEKDLGSEQLIPSDRTTKPSFFTFRNDCTISLQSFPTQPSLGYSKKHSCSVYN